MCMAPARLPTTETEWNEEKVKKIDRERDGYIEKSVKYSYFELNFNFKCNSWIEKTWKNHAHAHIEKK